MRGIDLFQEVKSSPTLRCIPVIVLSGSDEASNVGISYREHANAHPKKRVEPHDFISVVSDAITFWTASATLPPAGDDP